MNANMLNPTRFKVQEAAPDLKNGGIFPKKVGKVFRFGVKMIPRELVIAGSLKDGRLDLEKP